MTNHLSYKYAQDVADDKIDVGKYVKLQCKEFLKVANGKDKKYIINYKKVKKIDNILKLMIMPKGLQAGKTVYECIAGFQAFFIVSALCVVYRDDRSKRRYTNAILEICRKNGKTFLVAIIFLILFLTEPKFSKFFSVAPDGSLSREVSEMIKEILQSSAHLINHFKIKRDEIICTLNRNTYKPLNYSNSRLDGKLPSVFLVDETGALPNSYAIEAMRSGQLTVKNKLGCVISTKYPTETNPFEDEIDYAKKVLNGTIDDDKIFALLYEPDNTKDWATDDSILRQSNPLALEVTEIMEDLKDKRKAAIEMQSARQNFITKHCNIIYQGVGTENFVSIEQLKKGIIKGFNWANKEVYLGLDLAMTNDNCAVSMITKHNGNVVVKSFVFIPENRVDEKSKVENVDYIRFIREKNCFACGGATVDYAFIEEVVLTLEKKMKVKILGIGFDRYNCISSAQKFERAGYKTVEIKQHSSVLHPATKRLEELILNEQFQYEENRLLEINFYNAKVAYDTNMNKYVHKKKSTGKIDVVVGILNALVLMIDEEINSTHMDWVVMM